MGHALTFSAVHFMYDVREIIRWCISEHLHKLLLKRAMQLALLLFNCIVNG